MSVKAIGWVWDHSESEGAARLVILAIADCANASGNDAWPSMAELCRKTRLSERGVQKAVRRLVEIGELSVAANTGRGRTNRYRIIMETPNIVRGSEPVNPEQSSPRTEFAPEQSSPETPNVVRETPNHVRPEPSEPTTGTVQKTDPPVAPRKRGDRGTRLPDDFPVTTEMRTWAAEHAPDCGTADHDAFCDYWRSAPGAKGRKADWVATWRNWMRREQQNRTRAAPHRRSTTSDRVAQAQAGRTDGQVKSLAQIFEGVGRGRPNTIRGEIAQ